MNHRHHLLYSQCESFGFCYQFFDYLLTNQYKSTTDHIHCADNLCKSMQIHANLCKFMLIYANLI